MLACFPGIVFASDSEGNLTLLHGRAVSVAGMDRAGPNASSSIFDLFEDHPAIVCSIRHAL
ncbi:MAG TPA: hypothetical protein VG456_28715, partial [Candidatus Sulfopaludibacter sp.]|nr:hypothetical protein [Candidatus Sulfopaludibacter sp.]